MSHRNALMAALAILACATAVPTAVADGWFKEMGEIKVVTLGELIRDPHEYREIKVKLHLYFNEQGENFNPYYTRFIPEMYGNFSAWPLDARLYEKRDFQRCYPNFFMKSTREEWEDLKQLDRITSIEVVAVVREIFRGQPWIEVLEYSKLNRGFRDKDVRNAVRAEAYFHAGQYGEAARSYDRAIRSSLPASVQADLYRRMGDAQYAAGEYDDAESSYRRGLKAAPGSEVLERGALAARQAYERRHGFKSAAERPVDETPAPRSVPVVPDDRNDVDEIIRVFENAEDVEAEVARYRAEIEERAARVRSAAEVATVSGSEETPAAEGKEAAVGEEEGLEVVEAPAEQGGDEPVDGCAPDAGEEEAAPDAEGGAEQPVPEIEVAEEPVEEVAEEETAEEPVEEEMTDGCAEEVVEEEATEEPVEVAVEEEMTEEPAPDIEVVEEEAVEEEPVKTFEQVLAEQGADGHDGCAEEITAEEMALEETAEGCSEEEMTDGCAEDVSEEEMTEAPVEEEMTDGCAEEIFEEEMTDEEVASEDPDEGVVVAVVEDDMDPTDEVEEFQSEDPRVVMVAGAMVRLPRLPFFGCEDVSFDQFRSVLEEILRAPEE